MMSVNYHVTCREYLLRNTRVDLNGVGVEYTRICIILVHSYFATYVFSVVSFGYFCGVLSGTLMEFVCHTHIFCDNLRHV